MIKGAVLHDKETEKDARAHSRLRRDAHFLPITGIPRFALYLAAYLVIGFDILKKAAKGIGNGRVFDENFLMAVDAPRERLLKTYLPGPTAAELLKAGRLDPDWLAQVRAMCRLLYPAGLNIDYYPTNFVPYGGVLYYIDYECNPYAPQWDFEHWGMQYWTLSKP